MAFNIIVKNYQHYNSSMGKYIRSKREYLNEMAKGNYLPYEKACQVAEKARSNNKKPFALSKKAQEVIQNARNSSDRRGKVHLSDRLVGGMKEVGVNFYNNNIPKHYRVDMGGFDDAS